MGAEQQRQIIEHPPFRVPIGELVGNGLHSEIRELGEEHRLRSIRKTWRIGNWQKRLVEGIHLAQKYCAPFVVPSLPVIGRNHENKVDTQVVHKRIDGRPLKDFSYDDLYRNRFILEQLDRLTTGMVRMYEETGRLPDIHGSPQLVRQYDVKQTESIIVDLSDLVWLRDVEAVGPLWNPSWIAGSIHMWLHMRSLHRFRENLGLPDLRKKKQ